MGNRIQLKELEDTAEEGKKRPHTMEMLAFSGGGPHYGHPELPDVESFYRKDGTDSHIQEAIDFLTRIDQA
jgi:hypothetical protein